jgi:N-acetylneuraminic acid mutarotase
MTTTNAPPGRANPAVAWTGSEMVIFGGGSEFGPHPTENARYNPATNTWAPISTTNALTARRDMAYAWDGSQIIAWGGKAENGSYPNNATHRRYVVAENKWTNISFASAPTPRSGAKAVWADTTMLIFGGEDNTGALAQTYTYTPQRTYFFYVRP